MSIEESAIITGNIQPDPDSYFAKHFYSCRPVNPEFFLNLPYRIAQDFARFLFNLVRYKLIPRRHL